MSTEDRSPFRSLFVDEHRGLGRYVPASVATWTARTQVTLLDSVLYVDRSAPEIEIAAEPADRLLWKFTELADADASLILRFARRWGMLGLCSHGVPHLHGAVFQFGRGSCEPEQQESVIAWRDLALRMRGLLTATTMAMRQQVVPRAVWEEIGYAGPVGVPGVPTDEFVARHGLTWPVDMTAGSRVWLEWEREYGGKNGEQVRRDQKATIAEVINQLLEWAGLRVFVRWAEDGPQFGYTFVRGANLPAVLFLQAALAAGQAGDLFVCSACNQPYLRFKRPPRKGERNYCDPCHEDGAPERYATARYARGRGRQARKRRR